MSKNASTKANWIPTKELMALANSRMTKATFGKVPSLITGHMVSVSILLFVSNLFNKGVRSALDGNNSTYEMRKGHPFGRATVHSYEKKEEEEKKNEKKDPKKEKEEKKKDKKKKDKKKVEEVQDKLILTNSMCDGEDFVDGSHILITHKVNDSYYKSEKIVTAL